jgi:hypothetical protein
MSASFGVSWIQSCSPVENGSTANKVADVVAQMSESRKEMSFLPLLEPLSHGEVQAPLDLSGQMDCLLRTI